MRLFDERLYCLGYIMNQSTYLAAEKFPSAAGKFLKFDIYLSILTAKFTYYCEKNESKIWIWTGLGETLAEPLGPRRGTLGFRQT